MQNTYDPLKQYLSSNNQAFSSANLKDLAKSKGFDNYSMSDADNTKLAGLLNVPTTGVSAGTAKTVAAPAVYSGNAAADQFNNQIIPTAQKAQADLDAYNKSKLGATDKGGMEAPAPTLGATPAPSMSSTQVGPVAPAGSKTVYKADNTPVYVPLSTDVKDLPGYSETKVTEAVPVDTATLANGGTVKKYADGTYAVFDMQGNKVSNTTNTIFDNAKNYQSSLDRLNQATQGAFPLTASQQAQIDAVKATYAQFQKDQEFANANLTGGTTVGMNLYGLGNTNMAAGQIKDTVDKGISKVMEIQAKLASTVSQMTTAFQNDNLELLKQAYNAYSSDQESLSNTLSEISTNTMNMAKAEQAQKAADLKAVDDDIRTMINQVSKNGGAYDTETIKAMSTALANHDYAAAAEAAAPYITDLTTVTGQYAQYKKDATDAGIPKSQQLTSKEFIDQYKLKQTQAEQKALSLAEVNNAPFAATILRAASHASGLGKTDDAKLQLANLANIGDFKGLLGRVKDLVKQDLQAADKSEITKAETKVLALERMSKALKAYKAANGNMNILKGKEDDIGRALGKLAVDKTYGVIGTELDAAFQQYRQDMTGAAFGDQESREYAKVLPSKNNSFELNDVIIEGLKNYLSGKVEDVYVNALDEGYINLRDKAAAQKDFGQQQIETQVNKADAIKQYMTDDTYGPQIEAFWDKHPELSAQEIYDGMQQLNLLPASGPTSFNNVGGATNTASVVTDVPNKIVGGIDLNGYAVDENQPKAIATTYNKLAGMTDFTDYIKSKFPKSPITNAAIQTVANSFGIVPGILVALMQHESGMGTSPVALKNNNYGGITWSPTYAKNNPGVMKGSERPKAEWNKDGSPTYYVKFATPEDGLMAQAKLLSNRKIA